MPVDGADIWGYIRVGFYYVASLACNHGSSINNMTDESTAAKLDAILFQLNSNKTEIELAIDSKLSEIRKEFLQTSEDVKK